MGPDDITAWSAALGPIGTLVIVLAVFVIPILRRGNPEPDTTGVDMALLKERAERHKERLDDHDNRIKALENRRTR